MTSNAISWVGFGLFGLEAMKQIGDVHPGVETHVVLSGQEAISEDLAEKYPFLRVHRGKLDDAFRETVHPETEHIMLVAKVTGAVPPLHHLFAYAEEKNIGVQGFFCQTYVHEEWESRERMLVSGWQRQTPIAFHVERLDTFRNRFKLPMKIVDFEKAVAQCFAETMMERAEAAMQETEKWERNQSSM